LTNKKRGKAKGVGARILESKGCAVGNWNCFGGGGEELKGVGVGHGHPPATLREKGKEYPRRTKKRITL